MASKEETGQIAYTPREAAPGEQGRILAGKGREMIFSNRTKTQEGGRWEPRKSI